MKKTNDWRRLDKRYEILDWAFFYQLFRFFYPEIKKKLIQSIFFKENQFFSSKYSI